MKSKFFYNRISVLSIRIGIIFLLLPGIAREASAQCQLACNEEVHLSLNSICEFTVVPDMLLEGFDEVACEGEILTVELEDENGNVIGNVVGAEHRGMRLKASVVSSEGNRCWGYVLVEDKREAPLICDTVYTTCTGSLEPGAPVARNVSFAADIGDDSDLDGAFDFTFDIEVFGIDSAEILDVDFLIDMDIDNISDLTVTLTNPQSTSLTLVNGGLSASCTDGIMVTIDDEAMLPYASLQDACSVGEEKLGRFGPFQDGLSVFDMEEPKGTWQVQVTGTASGKINKLVLVLEQEGALVRFPGRGDVTGTRESANSFILSGIDACGDVLATYHDRVEEQECDNPIDKIIYRTWNASDEDGNLSDPCEQVIYVYRNDLSTLVLPPNYDGIQNPVLSCVDFADMHPDSTVTGYPTGDFCDKVQIFPIVDKRIDVCPGSYKLLREFTILEWCTEELITYTQLIKVADTTGPTLTGIEDDTISALPFECIGEYKVPKPDVFDACSDSFDYKVSYQYPDLQGNFDPEGRPFFEVYTEERNGHFYITNLPIGTTMVKWTVTDQCDQSTDSTFLVTVMDLVPPVAVCDEFTVVGIGAEGLAKVPAFVFDDLSHDNCGILKYEARKMTDACAISNIPFRDTITFCCAEIGDSIMVEFRVTDQSNNSNTCMVEVRVEDKLPPYIKRCPPDISIECDDDVHDLSLTGELIEGVNVFDNCGINDISYKDREDLDNCGIGTIYRTWTVEDIVGLIHTCVQEIYLIDSDPFDKDDLILPLDLDTMDCDANLDPKNLDERYRLRVNGDHCNMVAISYKDQPFYIVEDACEKILREWAIIDWCRYRPDSELGVFSHLQVLKKSNGIAPFINNCEDTIIGAYNSNCTADIDFELLVADDCTPRDKIQTYYEVDFNSDGTFTSRIKGNVINTVWPVGRHTVLWHVEDRCGNVSKCEQEIYVKDLKKPTPYCISSLTTVVMNHNGEIEIWARDHDFGSFDNCTEQEDLLFTFSEEHPVLTKLGDPHYFKGKGVLANLAEYRSGLAQYWKPKERTSSKLFDCDDVPDGRENRITLDMTVWDEELNSDYCTIELILQDNAGDACPDVDLGPLAEVTGSILTMDNQAIEGVDVFIGSGEENKVTTTGNNGKYAFTELETLKDYYLTAEKNDDAINGVNTLDIVKIQRHLLGIKGFETPDQILAADADNNNKITANDIVVLRKLILGVKDDFEHGQSSWRFVQSNFEMADMVDPFPIVDGKHIKDLTGNLTNQDLIGIKIGDVDGGANPKARGEDIKTRSNKTLVLTIPELNIAFGQEVNVPVSIGQRESLVGMQFSLDYDPAYLKFTGVLSDEIDILSENVGTKYEQDGIVTISWNTLEPQDLEEGDQLFSLQFEALEDHKLAINLNSAITQAEAYGGADEIMELSLESLLQEGEISLMQNNPNPFSDITRIDFTLPKAMQVNLDINDSAGKLIKQISGMYPVGRNSIQLSADEIEAKGILYYTLRAGRSVITKKMIKF